MTHPAFFVRLAASSLASFVVAAVPAVAQDSTPASGAAGFPISPDPAECRAAPRAADELLALWYDPAASPAAAATPAAATAAFTTAVSVPVGPPADAATTAAVAATVRELFACFATGDPLRSYALFTDDLARVFGPPPGTLLEEAEAFLAAPGPQPEAEQTEIVGLASPMVLPDGRVGAFIVEQGAGQGTSAAYAVFERQGDAWLVDGLVEFGVGFEEAQGGGTPTP